MLEAVPKNLVQKEDILVAIISPKQGHLSPHERYPKKNPVVSPDHFQVVRPISSDFEDFEATAHLIHANIDTYFTNKKNMRPCSASESTLKGACRACAMNQFNSLTNEQNTEALEGPHKVDAQIL